MRITNRMVTNNYLINLNNSFSELNKLRNRATTGDKYEKASEDPSSSLKAYNVRENLSRLELYQNNIKEVDCLVTETETAISQINNILTDVEELLVKGKSDTMASARKIIGEVIRNYQGQVYNIANTKNSGTYLFGGSNRMEMPFVINASGKLEYHGKDVASNNSADFPSEPLYYDIGLGLKTSAGGSVIGGTALDISNPGSEIFGTGIDADGISNNLYNLLGQIADAFDKNDMSQIDKFMAKIKVKSDENMINYVNVGQRSNFISFLKSRFETGEDNSIERLCSLEKVDTARAIIDWKTQEAAYNAALNMGSKIIQMSLLDYMR